jgi:predicted DNA repair protein MutK
MNMAGLSLLALLDDIVAVLDDIALMSKVAAKKTVGVLGDDLALNAQQVSGVRAERELPVVWAVAKGSFVNKAIIVPIALLLSAFLPTAITLLLLLGGLYLSYEGVEKVSHSLFHSKDNAQSKKAHIEANANNKIDLVNLEKSKIKAAIRTDFILSAEIVVIALGSIAETDLLTRVFVLILLAIGLTVFVYGLVATIVKLDDLGLYLLTSSRQNDSRFKAILGNGLLAFAPLLMKFLVVIGTIAMFLVGGGIIVHGIPFIAELIHGLEHKLFAVSPIFEYIAPILLTAFVGVIAGVLCLTLMTLITILRR